MRVVARYFAFVYCIAAIGINVTAEGIAGSAVRVLGLPTVFCWALSLFQKGRLQRFTAFHVAFLYFIVVQAVSRTWSVDPEATSYITSRYLLIFGMVLVLYDLYSETVETARMGLQAAVCGSAVVGLWTIYNWQAGIAYFDGNTRYAASGLHPNSSAFIVTIGIPVAIDLVRTQKRWNAFSVFNLVYPLPAMFALNLTGSRGGAVVAAPIFLWLLWTALRTSAGRVILPIAAFAALAYIPTNPELSANIERQFDVGQAQSDQLSGRTELWDVARQFFLDQPLTGVGGGGFRTAAGTDAQDQTGYFRGAHSSYLEVAAETGVPGLLGLVGMLLFPIFACFRVERSRRPPLLLATTIIPISMFYETFQWYYMAWAYAAVILASVHAGAKSREAEARATLPKSDAHPGRSSATAI